MAIPQRVTVNVVLDFPGRYIADPYWVELSTLIEIQTASGVNRARSEVKRAEALAHYLHREGISEEEYRLLEKLSKRPWNRVNDLDETSRIVVTSHKLYGCLIQACERLTSAARPCLPDLVRHSMTLSDFITEKTKADGVYDRMVQPKSGTGQPLSNQRSKRSDPYIENFKARGTVAYFPDAIHKADELIDFFNYAGGRVAVGAARKMDYGHFVVDSWDIVPSGRPSGRA